MINKLDVVIWGQKAGTLIETKEGYRNRVCFYFDPDFLKSGLDIAPLQVPVNGPVAQNGMPVYPESDKLFGGLPSFIADSLPDHWGNIVFNEWAKANHISKRELAPAYDFTFTVDVSAPYYLNTHSLSVNGRSDNIKKTDLLTIAKRFGVKSAESAISNMIEVAKNYREHAEAAGVPDFWIKQIEEEIKENTSFLTE